MKLLTISHPCVTPINQQFFAEVERQTGWELCLVIPSNWKNEYAQHLVPKRWSQYQGQLQSVPVWKSGNIPLHLYRSHFLRLLQKFQPDVIYVHHEPYALATTQVYIANALSIRKPIGFFTWQNIVKSYPFPFQKMQKFILNNSHFAVSGSYSAQKCLEEKGYQGKSIVLPGGVDLEIYFPHPEAPELKEKLRETDDEILIGYVGRIVEEKGLKTLLYALKQIESLSWRFIVVGAGAYGTEFDQIVEKLELTQRVTRLGFIPHSEAPLYLSALDLLALPSETRPNWKEQFGRVIIEAIACGTPVIGSDSGEIPNLIRATGGGLIFPEGNPEALAQKLRELILNSGARSRLIEQGQKRVKENYSNVSLAKEFQITIKTLV